MIQTIIYTLGIPAGSSSSTNSYVLARALSNQSAIPGQHRLVLGSISLVKRWLIALVATWIALGFASVFAQMGTPSGGQVSPGGAFTYSIPIRLPPGTSGVQPKLSLDYSSQSGNGIAGMGWSIRGLSVIMRCSQSFAIDGARAGVHLDTRDRFCLDGQRLIYQNGGTGYDTPGAMYYTEIFNGSRILQITPARDVHSVSSSYSSATLSYSGGSNPLKQANATRSTVAAASSGSQTTFRVQTKAGEIMEYAAADVGSGTITRMWLLVRVLDVNGNYWTVDYNRDTQAGEYLVAAINYTANDVAPVLAPYNKVTFEYEARPDVSVAFIGGVRQSNTKRLKAIQTHYTPAGGAMTPVARYTLSYGVSSTSERSLLSSVQEGAFDSASGQWSWMPPISFTYGSTDPMGSSWTAASPEASLDATLCGTVNPQDKAFNPGPTTLAIPPLTFYAPRNTKHLLSADVNGDGRKDILCVQNIGPTATQTYAALSNGAAFADWQPISPLAEQFSVSYCSNLSTVDLNADGLEDLFCVQGDGARTWAQINQGGSFSAWQVISPATGQFSPYQCGRSSDPSSSHMSPGPFAADLNGDGLPDLVCVYASDVNRTITWAQMNRFSTQTGENRMSAWQPISPDTGQFDLGRCSILSPVDVNGDGKADILCLYRHGVSELDVNAGSRAYVQVSQDVASADQATLSSWWTFTSPQIYSGFELRRCELLQPADVNGDGKTDIVCAYRGDNGSTSTYVMWSDGKQFLNSGTGGWNAAAPYTPSGFDLAQCKLFQAADINGDGYLDLVCAANEAGTTSTYAQLARSQLGWSFTGWTRVSYYSTFSLEYSESFEQQSSQSDYVYYYTYTRSVTPGCASTLSLDMDGDGMEEQACVYQGLGPDKNRSQIYVQRRTRNGVLDLMASVKSSLGLRTDITYAPLPTTLNNHYAAHPHSIVQYPRQIVTPPIPVVTHVTGDNATGSRTTVVHWYGGAVNQLDGRGFTGFAWARQQDQTSGLISQQNFHQTWPYIGDIAVTWQWTSDWRLLSYQHNWSASFRFDGGATSNQACGGNFSCLTYGYQSTSKAWDLNGAALPQNKTVTSVDSWGNPLQISDQTLQGTAYTNSGGWWSAPDGAATGYSKTTNNQYWNDGDKWWIGRLKKSAVTNVKPAN